MSFLFRKFPQNIFKSFRGLNIVWHICAIVITYFLVTSGFDWFYYAHTRSSVLNTIMFPAVVLGGLIPIFGLLAVLIIGKVAKKPIMVRNALVLGQAAIAGLLVSDLYKAFTGRAHPTFYGIAHDISKEFHFGFLKGGVFWGWPSSHTAVAFAMALALIILYRKNKKVVIPALIYAFYIGIGVSLSIHWFSDFIAGAIIGSVVGIAVGKSFTE